MDNEGLAGARVGLGPGSGRDTEAGKVPRSHRLLPHRLHPVLRDVEGVEVPEELRALAVREHVARSVEAAQADCALKPIELRGAKDGNLEISTQSRYAPRATSVILKRPSLCNHRVSLNDVRDFVCRRRIPQFSVSRHLRLAGRSAYRTGAHIIQRIVLEVNSLQASVWLRVWSRAVLSQNNVRRRLLQTLPQDCRIQAS